MERAGPGHRALAIIAVLVALGYLLGALAPVLTPFMFGAILSYVGTPVVAWLSKRGASPSCRRGAGDSGDRCFCGRHGAGGGAAGVVRGDADCREMPDLLTKIQDQWLPWINQTLGTAFSFDLSQLKTLAKDNAGAVGGLSAKLAARCSLAGRW